MADSKKLTGLTSVVCGAALLALAGCGGGGGGAPGASTGTAATTAATGDAAGGTGAVAETGSSSTGASSDGGAGSFPPFSSNSANPPISADASGSPVPVAAAEPAGPAPTLADCEMFPSNAIFNTRIDDTSRFPAHPNSWNWVNLVGAGVQFLANWSPNSNANDLGNYYGLPINYVDGTSATTDWPVVSFDYWTSGVSNEASYPQKSDCATASGSGFEIVRDCTRIGANQRRFPFPKSNVLSEGGNCGGPGSCATDRHVLVVETGACRLWESFFAHRIGDQWYAASTAAWDLRSLSLRPNDWASADAAGLPITPLLAKPAEAATGEIRHALRVTFSDAKLALASTWPGRFAAGSDNPGAIPFGSLLRLKANFQIPDSWSPQSKAVALAAKRYGMYVADNGPDFYIQGEPNSAWDPRTYTELKGISMADMEFVDLKAITGDPRFSPDSMQASW